LFWLVLFCLVLCVLCVCIVLLCFILFYFVAMLFFFIFLFFVALLFVCVFCGKLPGTDIPFWQSSCLLRLDSSDLPRALLCKTPRTPSCNTALSLHCFILLSSFLSAFRVSCLRFFSLVIFPIAAFSFSCVCSHFFSLILVELVSFSGRYYLLIALSLP
jgi:hypothetical protein